MNSKVNVAGKLPLTKGPTIGTRFSDQTGIFFRHFSPSNSKSFWQHVDMNDGRDDRGAQVGPQYRSKDELLTDNEDYLRRAGWLVEDRKLPQNRNGYVDPLDLYDRLDVLERKSSLTEDEREELQRLVAQAEDRPVSQSEDRTLPEAMSRADKEVSNKKPFEIPAINNEKLALMRYLNLNGDDDADYDKVNELERFKLDRNDVSTGYAHTVAVFEYDNERYRVVHAAAQLEADVVQEFNSSLWRIKKVAHVNQPASSPSPGL